MLPPTGNLPGGFFRVHINGYDVTLRTYPTWKPGMAMRLVCLPPALTSFPATSSAANEASHLLGTAMQPVLEAECISKDRGDVSRWMVEVPRLVCGPQRLLLPVRLEAAPGGRLSILSLPGGAREGAKLVCELTQLMGPGQPASMYCTRDEFDCSLPADAQPGDRLCVHSPDGAHALILVVPESISRSRTIRVRISSSGSV